MAIERANERGKSDQLRPAQLRSSALLLNKKALDQVI
jgi:hypothetical protein